MVKINVFFNSDSQDMERFLSDLRLAFYFGAGLVETDWNDNEGTALLVSDDVVSHVEKIADEYNLTVVK
jgi:hypothetical protein